MTPSYTETKLRQTGWTKLCWVCSPPLTRTMLTAVEPDGGKNCHWWLSVRTYVTSGQRPPSLHEESGHVTNQSGLQKAGGVSRWATSALSNEQSRILKVAETVDTFQHWTLLTARNRAAQWTPAARAFAQDRNKSGGTLVPSRRKLLLFGLYYPSSEVAQSVRAARKGFDCRRKQALTNEYPDSCQVQHGAKYWLPSRAPYESNGPSSDTPHGGGGCYYGYVATDHLLLGNSSPYVITFINVCVDITVAMVLLLKDFFGLVE
jgi:hypothetical protein